MHAQRRVSVPAPARTTRVNGGPRMRQPWPLPPYRPVAPGTRAQHDRGRDADGRRVPTRRPPAPAAERVDVGPRIELAPADGVRPRGYSPPGLVEESPAFPMDAFIIPEGVARLPRGNDAPSVARGEGRADTGQLGMHEAPRLPRGPALREQRARDVADRLEAMAAQLRSHGYEVLAQKSVRGDPLDALLAGVIAGYLVAAE